MVKDEKEKNGDKPQEAPKQAEVSKQLREMAGEGEPTDTAEIKKQRTIKEAKLLEGGAHYEIDEQGNKTLVLSQFQIEQQEREEKRKKELLEEADNLLAGLHQEESKTFAGEMVWKAGNTQWYPEHVKSKADALEGFGCDVQAKKLYEKALEMIVNNENWTAKTEEGKKIIIKYCRQDGGYTRSMTTTILEKVGRGEEANIVRIAIADKNLREAEEYFYRRLSCIKRLQEDLGYYRELAEDSIRSDIRGFSGDWLDVALRLYQEVGDQKGAEKALEAKKRYAEAEKKEYEKVG